MCSAWTCLPWFSGRVADFRVVGLYTIPTTGRMEGMANRTGLPMSPSTTSPFSVPFGGGIDMAERVGCESATSADALCRHTFFPFLLRLHLLIFPLSSFSYVSLSPFYISAACVPKALLACTIPTPPIDSGFFFLPCLQHQRSVTEKKRRSGERLPNDPQKEGYDYRLIQGMQMLMLHRWWDGTGEYLEAL